MKHDDPVTDRLFDFASNDWKCKAMYQLSFSTYCPPGAFCDQTILANLPTSLDGQEDWEMLAKAEVRIWCCRSRFVGVVVVGVGVGVGVFFVDCGLSGVWGDRWRVGQVYSWCYGWCCWYYGLRICFFFVIGYCCAVFGCRGVACTLRGCCVLFDDRPRVSLLTVARSIVIPREGWIGGDG